MSLLTNYRSLCCFSRQFCCRHAAGGSSPAARCRCRRTIAMSNLPLAVVAFFVRASSAVGAVEGRS